MGKLFSPADILLPQNCQLEKWSVIACDQYTSDALYWKRVRQQVGNAPSTLQMILPEAEQSEDDKQAVDNIHAHMSQYLSQELFREYPNAYVYVERTLLDGTVRQGIVGIIDLEAYDPDPKNCPKICATESTVSGRMPVRIAVRREAALEFPHTILLCGDDTFRLIEPVGRIKDRLPLLYSFTLMEGGGHISGWLLCGENAAEFECALKEYEKSHRFFVGDGNHSLLAAKRCYEEDKIRHSGDLKERYALVELENLYSPANVFEPIHRTVTGTDAEKLLDDLQAICVPDGIPVQWASGKARGLLTLAVKPGELAVEVLQRFLDGWLTDNPGNLDYIHEESAALELALSDGAVSFILPKAEKKELFAYIQTGHTLPRKTFSMGHGSEKRYYLEGRKIK